MNRRKRAFSYLMIFCALSASFTITSRADDYVASKMEQISNEHPEIPVAAMKKAFTYYEEHASEVKNKNYITIIDFNQPSTHERMYVIDLRSMEVSTYLVAHGRNSGQLYANQFSNVDGLFMSSLGIYLTGTEYIGKHGFSMRLLGKEQGNSNAYSREIVLHGAPYVSHEFAEKTGRLGRSEGCTAVEQRFAPELVKKLEGGSVYLVYHN